MNNDVPVMTYEQYEKFSERVTISGECWIFKADITNDRYRTFSVNGSQYSAHRVSYVYFKGLIPDGLIVCHTCNDKRCVNPEHLYAGTYRDNAMDAGLARRNGSPRPKVTIINIAVPDGITARQFKNEIKMEALRRGINSQELIAVAIQNELAAKVVKQETRK